MLNKIPCGKSCFRSKKGEDAVVGEIFARLVFPSLALLIAVNAASAEAIAIGNYGSSANGMPFGVALAKGYFQEEGANVTSIIASEGGGTSVRNAMSGGMPSDQSTLKFGRVNFSPLSGRP